MYSHMLVPTDGSDLSTEAIASAVKLAKALGAHITFLFVQPEYPSPIVGEGAIIAPESREEFTEETKDQANEILKAVQAIAEEGGVPSEVHTEISDVPYEAIVSTAEDRGCDMVFMASRGRKGLASLLLGSQTQKVLTHCKIPVLVYR